VLTDLPSAFSVSCSCHVLCLQEAALLHALQFPALQRLVYSTCSIHQRENEDVVAAVLPTATAAGFRLVDPFPTWHRRGLPVVEGAELLVRTDAHADGTDGFFVAVFECTPEQPQQQAGEQLQQTGEQQQQLAAKKKKRRKAPVA
jgi:putative methyltransferase